MKLNDIEFSLLLPQFMQDDSAVRGLSAAIDSIVPQLYASIELLPTWDCLDYLSSDDLDALAWELNILWYDSGADIAVKRELIRNSDKVYSHLGTKWAVENVIKTYFGDGYIMEWFEYDGTPGHFRVYSANPTINNERLTEFLNILENVKRASAKLDGITITLSADLSLYSAIALHETSAEQYTARV